MLYPMFVHHQPFGGFSGELPDFPGCTPEGDTLDELLDNVQNAATCWLAEHDAETLPEPSSSNADGEDCPPMLVDILPLNTSQIKDS